MVEADALPILSSATNFIGTGDDQRTAVGDRQEGRGVSVVESARP
jgi:hypothetical protein